MFDDNDDRNFFIERLGKVVSDTETQCFAWALISAIFFLEESDRDEAVALKKQDQAILMVFEAAKEVWKSVWERVGVTEKIEQSSALFHNAAEMAGVIPAYRLRVTLHGEFWKEMERVLF